MPRQSDGHACCTLALYEAQALEMLERVFLEEGPERARLAAMIDHPRTIQVELTGRGAVNVNTPEELRVESEGSFVNKNH